MKAMEEQVNVIALLEQHEIALSKLYDVYGDKFPESASFWSELSKEEVLHARWVRALDSEIGREGTSYNEGRFRIGAIRSSLAYVRRVTSEARTERLKLINALSIALDIEKALLENKFFEAVEGDSPVLRRAMIALSEGTQEHVKRVEAAWEEEREARAIK